MTFSATFVSHECPWPFLIFIFENWLRGPNILQPFSDQMPEMIGVVTGVRHQVAGVRNDTIGSFDAILNFSSAFFCLSQYFIWLNLRNLQAAIYIIIWKRCSLLIGCVNGSARSN